MSDFDTVRAGRVFATKKYPYLSTALFSMQLVQISDSFPTMGVDNKWRCYYSKKAVEDWGVEVTASVLVHEVWHLLRKHHERICGRCSEKWNQATDREINDDLRGLKFPFQVLLPEQISMASNLTAEEYYLNEKSEGGFVTNLGFGGSCSDGIKRDWEIRDNKNKENGSDNETPNGLTPFEAESVIKQTAQEIQNYYKNQGYNPRSISMWANSVLSPPKLNYKKELRSRLCKIIKRGNDDVSYNRPNYRRSAGDFVFPGSFSLQPRIAVIIDTSGSMMGEGSKVLSEVNSILKSFDDIVIISADTQIHNIQKVTDVRKICAIGGGGTSMKKAIEDVDKMRVDVILCITDGYTDWNDRPTKAKQITLLTEKVAGPKFGRSIFI